MIDRGKKDTIEREVIKVEGKKRVIKRKRRQKGCRDGGKVEGRKLDDEITI